MNVLFAKGDLVICILGAVRLFLSVGLAVIFLILGPGPKCEEIFALIVFTIFLLAAATLLSLISPDRRDNTVFFTVGSLMGWVGSAIRVADQYRYDLFSIPLFNMSFLVAGGTAVYVYIVNCVGLKVRDLLRKC